MQDAGKDDGKPHLHDEDLARGLRPDGTLDIEPALPSGGDFCRLFDRYFGISSTSLRPHEVILGDWRVKAAGRQKATEMLAHPDAENLISRAFLPRVDWLDSHVFKELSTQIIQALDVSTGTASAGYNASFICLVTAMLQHKERARLEQARTEEAQARSPGQRDGAAAAGSLEDTDPDLALALALSASTTPEGGAAAIVEQGSAEGRELADLAQALTASLQDSSADDLAAALRRSRLDY